MRNILVPVSFAAAFSLLGAAAYAQHGPGGVHAGGPKGPMGGSHGGPQSGAPHGPQPGAPRGPQAGGRAPDGAGRGPHTDGPKDGDHGGKHGAARDTPRAGTSGTTGTTTSPIAQKIEQHPQLASRLSALLPQGVTLDQAAMGFKNQGQFIAALHVSRNLGLSFADLKTQMVTNHKSLGQSIQTLKPTTNATTETKLAEVQTHDDLDHEGPIARAPKTPDAREQGDH